MHGPANTTPRRCRRQVYHDKHSIGRYPESGPTGTKSPADLELAEALSALPDTEEALELGANTTKIASDQASPSISSLHPEKEGEREGRHGQAPVLQSLARCARYRCAAAAQARIDRRRGKGGRCLSFFSGRI